jgi:hypothetical protein
MLCVARKREHHDRRLTSAVVVPQILPSERLHYPDGLGAFLTLMRDFVPATRRSVAFFTAFLNLLRHEA